jgi:chromosome partitioning protein
MRISVTNLKGGVGKTTIATNLAVAFSQRGKSVCIVDTDLKQHSAMEWAGNRDKARPHISVFGVTDKQLNQEVEKLKTNYDIVIIDGVPQLSEVAERTIIASDMVIIPISPSIYDFRAFESFLEKLEQVNENRVAYGLGKVKSFVVMNRVNERAKLSGEISDAVRDYDVPVLNTRIINRTAYADTATAGLGVVEGKDAKARDEFNRLTDEIEQAIKEFSKK